MTDQPINILKASGERCPFSEKKLSKSLERSGAGTDAIQAVVKEVKKKLYEGIPSSHIYRTAFALLKTNSRSLASKYKLKQGIMELGPSGFPFEKFIAEILKNSGFSVKLDQIVKGHCVSHEIDVIAEKEDKRFMVECKYHNTGISCDVKIPLYIRARFSDIEKEVGNMPEPAIEFHQGWLVTNTKFSADAIQYGTCVGLNLVGWDFPQKGSLRELIDASGLYPLTCLLSLTQQEKQKLLGTQVVLCRDIFKNPQILVLAGFSEKRREIITKEINDLCASLEKSKTDQKKTFLKTER